ncbi:MAG: nucleotide exchange factor GrpE [Kiritimatiellales bacterium]
MSKKDKQDTAPEQPEAIVEKAVTPVVAEEEPLRDQLLRLRADFDNFRKRTQRERSELFLMANETLFLEMLPIIDHFEMGFKSAEEHKTDCSVTEGFRMVYNQLLDVLKKFNVTDIDTIGEAFDPHRHESLLHMPSDKPAGIVIEQIRRGYMLGEKLLRAAQVIVSSGPQENATQV